MPPRRVWIVGPAAWDTVLYLDENFERGRFTQSCRTVERPGGSAANVAQALASSGVDTAFVSALGCDDYGRALRGALETSGLRELVISPTPATSGHAIVVVDASGERTMFGANPDTNPYICLADATLEAGDIVVFVVWHESFLADLGRATSAGCVTVVGLGALEDPRVAADIAFGSRSDLVRTPDVVAQLERFGRIVMTSGAEGATQWESGDVTTQAALRAVVVDTTGAGDSFLAGYLLMYSRGFIGGSEAMAAGARWAAAMVSLEASVPPPWPEVLRMTPAARSVSSSELAALPSD